MTTEALFRDDAYLRACDARVLEVGADGLLLDRTVFYPLGGGQAGDAGVLRLADGRSLVIADARKGEAGRIRHVPAAGQDLSAFGPGTALTAAIDWPRRHRLMRLHTTTHLLCALLPYAVNGCSITAEYARMDFDTAELFDAAVLNAGLARLVSEAHAVTSEWITDAELDANPQLVRTMSVQPPRGSGRVRLLRIAGVDLQPCGGTHVANTAEIGAVRITKMEKKGATTRRVLLALDAPA
jgi:misacylated tRNA(Ala) deacylase